jgi:hypothetical protein
MYLAICRSEDLSLRERSRSLETTPKLSFLSFEVFTRREMGVIPMRAQRRSCRDQRSYCLDGQSLYSFPHEDLASHAAVSCLDRLAGR